MNTIDRNPDICWKHDSDIPDSMIPAGYYIHYGKLLPQRAKTAGIPFGVATKRTYYKAGKSCSRNETVGLVIRIEDQERMTIAAMRGPSHKAKP